MGMHDDELPIDAELVRRLVSDQFPRWRNEPIRRLESEGTVNAIYRVGPDLTARLPLREVDPADGAAELAREGAAMHEFAACCPFPTPRRVAEGVPGFGFPLPWSVQTWLPGDVATPDGLAESEQFTRDLVTLLRALRQTDPGDRRFGGRGRGGNLRDSDEWMETCFRESEAWLPTDRLRALWAAFRVLPRVGRDAMTHGDLIPGNLLVDGERLVGVLDGGGFGPADPALDLVVAWHLLAGDARARLRSELGCADLEWQRGAAWAFEQSMGIVWYYRESNPRMSALGRSTLARLLGDPAIA